MLYPTELRAHITRRRDGGIPAGKDLLRIAEFAGEGKRWLSGGGRVVRPEGLEPPTLWFEAKCSIQLSYRRVWKKDSVGRGFDQCGGGLLGGGGGVCGRWGWRRGGEHGEGFEDVEAGAAEELADDGFGEAGGVVLDADGLFGFLEVDAADAVDLAQIGDGKGGGFGRGRAVAVQDIKLGHGDDDSSG